ncbi:MAG: hypothetical protein J6S21_01730 [Victivallales bacterium]|nr:hypothetical protein [Victivallales bacterium]
MSSSKQLPGIYLSDFSSVTPEGRALPISDYFSPATSSKEWELIPYTSNKGDGVMLTSREGLSPEPVTIATGIKGWHKIYVCMISNAPRQSGISLQLSGDNSPTFMMPGVRQLGGRWVPTEAAEESFWKCAELDGDTITIGKLPGCIGALIGLLWLRFVPMTDEDVAALLADRERTDTTRMHAHTDLDWLGLIANYEGPKTLQILADNMVDSDVKIISTEIYPLLNEYTRVKELLDANGGEPTPGMDVRTKQHMAYKQNQKEILESLINYSHSKGLKIYTALRMALSRGAFHFDRKGISMDRFAFEHPEYCCIDRDGEPYQILSYAYPEVQDYSINALVQTLEYGADGLTLILHRGVMTLFEEPVIQLFKSRYPGVDPVTLPMNDERLKLVHCEIMTGFIRRLRKACDDFSAANNRGRIAINAIADYGLDDNRRYGIDLKVWSEEKLIDSFVVSNMAIWEDEEAILDENGLVDMDKYRRAKYLDNFGPIQREFGNCLERKLAHVEEHLELERKYGVTAFFEMPWECTETPVDFRNYAVELRRKGVTNLSLWDCFHTRNMRRSEWQIAAKLGHIDDIEALPEDEDAYSTVVRMTSFNGVSIASYHPNWRG